jgi:anti-sigma regulatory factor (Ser/Thr protein kinase)
LTTTPVSQHSIVLSNQAAEIRRLSEWLEHVFTSESLPSELLFRFDLSVNEAMGNIISYAYNDLGTHNIEAKLSVTKTDITLQLIDDGIAFDPLSLNDRQSPADLDNAELGGLGIELYKHYMDDCRYMREDNKNVLSLSVKRPKD